MSSEFVPSRSTVYTSNLPFSLTTSDITKIFSTYGRIRKVKVLKCTRTRKSRGVAFVQFFSRDDAMKCVNLMDKKEIGGRTINCNMARDNGREAEFMKKKNSTFKDICFECGDSGHISYECPKNVLGSYKPKRKMETELKSKKKHKQQSGTTQENIDSDQEADYETLSYAIKKEKKHKQQSGTTQENIDSDQEADCETLSYAIKKEQEVVYGASPCPGPSELKSTRKVYKRSAYFSDEEYVSD